MTRSPRCARRCSRSIRISPASARSCRAARRTCASSRWLGGNVDKAPFAAAIEDFYLTNPIARASAIMGECSALAEARTTMTAAE